MQGGTAEFCSAVLSAKLKPAAQEQGTRASGRNWAGTGKRKGQDLSASLLVSRNTREPHLLGSTKPSGHGDRGAQQGTGHLPVQTPHLHAVQLSELRCLPYPEGFLKLRRLLGFYLRQVQICFALVSASGGFWVQTTVCWWIRLFTGVLMTLLSGTLEFKKVIFTRKSLQNILKLN